MAVVTTVRTPSAKIYIDDGDAFTAKAGAAITYRRFLKFTTGGLGNHPAVIHATGTNTATGAGGNIIGVSHFSVDSGADVSVLATGIVEVEAGEALTSGDEVAVGANGVAMKATANTQATTSTYALTYGLQAVGACAADTASGDGAPIALYYL